MKKVLVCLMILCGLSLFTEKVNAQVCKISGSNDNVEVFNCYIEGDNVVVVDVSNDSNNIRANVTLTVEVNYGGSLNKTFTGKVLSKPGSTTACKIPIDSHYGSNKPKSAKVISITGTKCL